MSSMSSLKSTRLKFQKSSVAKGISKSYKKYAHGFERPSILLNLEPRMMFDGAAPVSVDDAFEVASQPLAESLPEPSTQQEQSTNNAGQGQSHVSSVSDEGIKSTEASLAADQPIDGIADSLEVSNSEQVIITASDAQDALGIDGAIDIEMDLSTDGVFGIESSAAPMASENFDLDEQEQQLLTEEIEQQQIDDEFEDAQDPVVSRVVFIDTSVTDFEELLNGVVTEIEMGTSDGESETIINPAPVLITDSADADLANPSTAPPELNNVSEDIATDVATEDLGASNAELQDADYLLAINQDQPIIIDGVAIYLLDSDVDQLQAVTTILSHYTELDAVDIVSYQI